MLTVTPSCELFTYLFKNIETYVIRLKCTFVYLVINAFITIEHKRLSFFSTNH